MQRCDRSGYLGCIINLGESIAPRSIAAQMALDILDQMPYPFAGVVAGTVVMDIAKGSLDRVGARTVGG